MARNTARYLSRDGVEKLRQAYAEAAVGPPPTPERVSYRTAFTGELAEVLQELLAAGWTADQLAGVAAEAGFPVAASTMRAYLAAAAGQRSRRASPRTARQRRPAAAADEPTPVAAGTEPVVGGAADAAPDAADAPEGRSADTAEGAPLATSAQPLAPGEVRLVDGLRESLRGPPDEKGR